MISVIMKSILVVPWLLFSSCIAHAKKGLAEEDRSNISLRGCGHRHRRRRHQCQRRCNSSSNDNLLSRWWVRILSSRILFTSLFDLWRMLLMFMIIISSSSSSSFALSSSYSSAASHNNVNWWSRWCLDAIVMADAFVIHASSIRSSRSSVLCSNLRSGGNRNTNRSSSTTITTYPYTSLFFRRSTFIYDDTSSHLLLSKTTTTTAANHKKMAFRIFLRKKNNTRSNHDGEKVGWIIWSWKWPRKRHDANSSSRSSSSIRHRNESSSLTHSSSSSGGMGSTYSSTTTLVATATTIILRQDDRNHHPPKPLRKGILQQRRNNATGISKLRRLILLPTMIMLSSAMTPVRRRLSRFGTHYYYWNRSRSRSSTIVRRQTTSTTSIVVATKNYAFDEQKRANADRSRNESLDTSSNHYEQFYRRPHHGPPGIIQLRRHVGRAFSMAAGSALSFRGGGRGEVGILTVEEEHQHVVRKENNNNNMVITKSEEEEDTFVIETQMFPIHLPRTFEPPTNAIIICTSSAETAATTKKSLEITVASSTSSVIAASSTPTMLPPAVSDKPPVHLLHAASQTLLPKHLVIPTVEGRSGFTGRELFYPEAIDALVETGLQIASSPSSSQSSIRWVGEKNTDKFLKDHTTLHPNNNNLYNCQEWYTALHSTQEVLVWVGKFLCGGGGNNNNAMEEYYGAELPIIKTTSIVHQSPKYLAELLMDSSRVRLYNKMSLGRLDIQVLQKGVDTQDGLYGDGESKVVRNLTKPPMVNSELEFVTFMHSRRLRPDHDGNSDARTSSVVVPPTNGYIVVSRAIIGDNSDRMSDTNDSDEDNNMKKKKFIRNEILLGVNILKAVPGEPNWTELTSVTHVYSPLIPLMLAKNAGVKGAVDFVRDIRALP